MHRSEANLHYDFLGHYNLPLIFARNILSHPLILLPVPHPQVLFLPLISHFLCLQTFEMKYPLPNCGTRQICAVSELT